MGQGRTQRAIELDCDQSISSFDKAFGERAFAGTDFDDCFAGVGIESANDALNNLLID